MKLWVDDLRPAPVGYALWAFSSEQAILILEGMASSEGLYVCDEISLDHDLGGDDTTRPVVLWLCEHPDQWPAVVPTR